MATYKNKKTGTIVLTDSELRGNWELVEKAEQMDEKHTIPELKSILTELGVDFDPNAKKAELLALYQENKA